MEFKWIYIGILKMSHCHLRRGRGPAGIRGARKDGGGEYDQSTLYMYENVIMKPIKMYEK
jgi:hypothetical protein